MSHLLPLSCAVADNMSVVTLCVKSCVEKKMMCQSENKKMEIRRRGQREPEAAKTAELTGRERKMDYKNNKR